MSSHKFRKIIYFTTTSVTVNSLQHYRQKFKSPCVLKLSVLGCGVTLNDPCLKGLCAFFKVKDLVLLESKTTKTLLYNNTALRTSHYTSYILFLIFALTVCDMQVRLWSCRRKIWDLPVEYCLQFFLRSPQCQKLVLCKHSCVRRRVMKCKSLGEMFFTRIK
jgi:hypothetical protein